MPRKGPTPRRRTVVRYVDAAGNRCKKGDPGARPVRATTDTYYAKLGGRWVSLKTADLGTAWQALRRLQREAADRAAGIRTAGQDAALVPLADHVAAWERSLRHRDLSPGYVASCLSDVRRLSELAGWKRLTDLTADSLLAALAALRDQGRSARTRICYQRHAHLFAAWCVPKLLPANPFAGMEAPNPDTDQRHRRRCPSTDEVQRLFVYLHRPDCPRRGSTKGQGDGMTGPQRAMGYRVAMGTGFRADELRSLTRESFDLDGGTVTLAVREDKARRAVVQPLPAWLIAELREWFGAGGECWGRFPAHDPGRILQSDLEAAGIPYSTPGPNGPLFFDMHSLRVWYCTELANQPGITPKTLMELCRHSDPRLTLALYARAKRQDVRDAADRVPAPPTGRP